MQPIEQRIIAELHKQINDGKSAIARKSYDEAPNLQYTLGRDQGVVSGLILAIRVIESVLNNEDQKEKQLDELHG